jgi:hypothetical protein
VTFVFCLQFTFILWLLSFVFGLLLSCDFCLLSSVYFCLVTFVFCLRFTFVLWLLSFVFSLLLSCDFCLLSFLITSPYVSRHKNRERLKTIPVRFDRYQYLKRRSPALVVQCAWFTGSDFNYRTGKYFICLTPHASRLTLRLRVSQPQPQKKVKVKAKVEKKSK